MRIMYFLMFVMSLLALQPAQAQSENNKKKNKMEKKITNTNPLICDPEEGACALPSLDSTSEMKNEMTNTPKKVVKIIYYTDPICSSCWGIEPQLRRLKLEYGHAVEIDYRMGGLLPDWSYNSGGISKPSDVAHHWDEVSLYYKMPIDGDVWLEDPLSSSYPPSIAMKAAQLQSTEKAVVFMRELRELLFLKKKNITKWEVVEEAAQRANLNLTQLKEDYEGKAKQLFQDDLAYARQLGVRGFPTLFFTNEQGTSEYVYGFRPYEQFEAAVKKVFPTIEKQEYEKSTSYLLHHFSSLTVRELAELAEMSWKKAEQELERLVDSGSVVKIATKNGALYKRK